MTGECQRVVSFDVALSEADEAVVARQGFEMRSARSLAEIASSWERPCEVPLALVATAPWLQTHRDGVVAAIETHRLLRGRPYVLALASGPADVAALRQIDTPWGEPLADAWMLLGPGLGERIAMHLKRVGDAHAARQAASANALRLRALVAALPIPFLLVDLEAGTVIDGNDDAFGLLERPREAVVNESVAVLFRRRDTTSRFVGRLREVAQSRGVVEVVVRDTDDRPPRTFHLRVAALDNGSAPLAAVVLSLPREPAKLRQTRRRLEEHRRRADKLAAVGQLVSGIAHEINNPISIIKGLALLLLEDPRATPFDQELREVCDAAERCEAIVRGLRQYTNLAEAVLVPMDLNAVCRRAAELVDEPARQAGVRLELHAERDLPAILGDAALLEEVVVAITHNAIEAIEEADRGSLVRIATHSDDRFVWLSIYNDGPPIPGPAMRRLFDPFFTTKEVGKGSGLGLSYCYGIVKEHAGDITVRSEESYGTEFVICLPRADVLDAE